MKVIIHDEVFANDNFDELTLTSIIKFGYQGQHSILTSPTLNQNFEPQEGTNLNGWLERQSDSLTREVIFALEMGIEGVREPSANDEIHITAKSESIWDDEPLYLSLNDAQRLLNRSLHILVENGRNDGKFIETMIKRVLGESFWEPLERAFENGWIQVDNGGGIGEMKKIVSTLIDDPVASTRTCAVFDSDAPKPDSPSNASETLRTQCEECGIAHHQLNRRAAENYLPRKALEASVNLFSWPNTSHPRKVVSAFSNMNRDQRHHFHMKKGFTDEEICDPPSLFRDVSKEDRICLKQGFVRKITDLFYEEKYEIRDSWIEKDYSREDKNEIIKIYNLISTKI